MDDGRDWVLSATQPNTEAPVKIELRELGQDDAWWSTSATGVEQITHGWLQNGVRGLDDLFVAVLANQGVLIHRPGTGKQPVGLDGLDDVEGRIGCHDLTGDGQDDIVIADVSEQPPKLHVFRREIGSFTQLDPLAFGPTGDPVDMAFLDANGDGLVDVCVGMRRGDVIIFFGNGTGDFPEMTVTYAGPDLEALRAADLDNDPDGRDEIIVSVGTPGLFVLRSVED